MKIWKVAIAWLIIALLAGCPEELALGPVSGLSPESGATISDTTPVLEWNYDGYSSYEIQAADNPAAFSTAPAIKVEDNEFIWKTPLSDGDAIYWRVRGIDHSGNIGPWSATHVLYIYEGAVPGLRPSSGSISFNAKPTLSWNAVNDTLKYQVQLRKGYEPNDHTSIHEVTELSYTPDEPLDFGQTYYWRVRTENKDGINGAWSATSALELNTGALSGLAPADESKTSNTTPTFSWNDVEGAARYELRIANSKDGLESVSPIYTEEAEYTPSQDLSDNQTYYWQVRAADNDGEFGEWSEVLSLWIGYTIGTHGPAGGVIFYDKGDYTDGWRWLEAMPFDQSTSINAGSHSSFTKVGIGKDVFDSYKAIGLGKSNTEFIVAGLGDNRGTAYAAKTCYDLEWGGYDDWFLPSIDELHELHKQKDAVGGGFIDEAYWSSSPSESGWYAKYFGSGSYEYEETLIPVRAVRAVGKVGSVSVQNAFVSVMAPTPALNWNAVDDAVRYDVQMAESYTELANARTISVTGTSYTPAENLADDQIRYWRVRAVNSRGEKGMWTLSFLTVASPITKEFVQGGTFQMGSTDSEAASNESPVHSVTVDSFHMAKTEVTFAQYDAYCTDTGISKPSDSGMGRGSRPVVNVSWYDAVKYSNWLSEQEGLTPAYEINSTSVTWNQTANGYRLPTEAEWEYGARGGRQSKGYKYSGSDDVGEVGWYDDNSGNKNHPVKGKKANELGLYDMSGNVWEWCWDWYGGDYYESSPPSNPTGPSSGSSRIIRGGSSYNFPGILRVAFRYRHSPDGSANGVGFRLALGAVTATTHTVSFQENGGSSVSSQQVEEGSYASEPTAPTRSGHVFRGWYGDSGLTNVWDFDSDTVNGDTTLYAKWEIILHTVSFHENGGSSVSSQQVEEGSYASEPTAPTRSGYIFQGWYSDSGLTDSWDFGSDTVNGDTTLYARWEIPPTTSIEKIFVQGGTFQMGSTDSEADSDESPVHSVTVDSFYMAETEVTHRQYLAFLNGAGVSAAGQLNGNEVIDMDDSDVAFSHDGTKFSFAGSSYADDIDCPVIEVTWYGAVEYSNWLSEQEGLSKAYSINGTSVSWNQSANGYRLPTEAEWEYAARGGVQSNGYKYAGSSDLDEVGWYRDNSGSKTHPVKGKKANELGLYDMSGNVREWCWDWYDSDYYSSSPENNPTGPSSGSYRVYRGGSWLDFGGFLRSADRGRDSPGISSDYLGFRPVRRTVTF